MSLRHRCLCYYFVIEYDLRGARVKEHRNEAWKDGECTGVFLTHAANTCYPKQWTSMKRDRLLRGRMTTTSKTVRPREGKRKKASAGFLLLIKCSTHGALTPPKFCITDDLVGWEALSGYTYAT